MSINFSATGNTVGGVSSGAANVISGNTNGVFLSYSGTSGNVVLGNLIGTDNLGNTNDGVLVANGASANLIGGTAADSGNTIAFNLKGVVVTDNSTTGNSILGNSIFGNTSLGIDLGDDGSTPNDTNPRAFPNDGQNTPVITSAGGTTVSGTLTSTANTSFLLEFFTSPTGADYQGQTFLGSLNVTTDPSTGQASFSANVSSIPANSVTTATATNLATGDTSEFFNFASTLSATTIQLSSSNSSSVYGQSVTFTASVTSASPGTPTGTVTFYEDQIDAAHQIGPARTLSGGSATGAPISNLTASASHAIYAVYNGDSNFSGSDNSSNPLSQMVTRATPTITWSNPSPIVNPSALSGTQLDATASVAGTYSYSPSAGTVLPAGTQTLSLSFTPTDTTDYTNASATVTLVVLGPGLTPVGSVLYLVGGTSSNDNVQINPVGANNTGSTGVQVNATLNKVSTSKTYNQAFTAIVFIGFAGSDNISGASTLAMPITVTIGNGNDNVQLGNGNNTITLGNGSDNVTTGNGTDSIALGGGNDNVNTGNGNKTITAGNGCDNVTAGTGTDVVTLGNGNDNIHLGDGNNTVTLGIGNDNVNTGNGTDSISLGGGNDNVNTGNGNKTITAGNGYDNVTAGTGTDVVTLGNGSDNVHLGGGNNTVMLGNGNDNVNTGNGTDSIALGSGSDNVTTGNGNKTITAGNGNINLNAGTGTDMVTLGNGNDNIHLGDGNNTLTVGNGNDNINVGNGANVVVEGNGSDNVSVGNGANLIVAGTGQHNVNAGNGNNILIDGSVTLTQAGDSLRQVLTDWATQDAAVNTIRSRLAVTDNSTHANHLSAGSGHDWFFFTDAQDTSNRKPTDWLN